MRHEQRAGPGVEKCASEARERIGTRFVASAGSRVAGRQRHPIGIELELGDFGCHEQTVIFLRGLRGRRQEERRLGPGSCEHLGFASQKAMGGEMHHASLRKRAVGRERLDGFLAGLFS
jgi:hypothetical protein